MSLFKRERATEIETVSGTVRVTVTPKPAWIALLFEAVGIVVFGVFILRNWPFMVLWYRGLLLWAIASAVVAWFYQMSGLETIEFDVQKLSIAKQVLGWTRTVEYRIDDCRELEWREGDGEGTPSRLQCKLGWRTVTFGKYISKDEGDEVLAALQGNLTSVAQKLCAMPGTKHFTRLNLS